MVLLVHITQPSSAYFKGIQNMLAPFLSKGKQATVLTSEVSAVQFMQRLKKMCVKMSKMGLQRWSLSVFWMQNMQYFSTRKTHKYFSLCNNYLRKMPITSEISLPQMFKKHLHIKRCRHAKIKLLCCFTPAETILNWILLILRI